MQIYVLYIRSPVIEYEMQIEQEHDRKSVWYFHWNLWLIHALSFLPTKRQAVPVLHPVILSSWALNDT